MFGPNSTQVVRTSRVRGNFVGETRVLWWNLMPHFNPNSSASTFTLCTYGWVKLVPKRVIYVHREPKTSNVHHSFWVRHIFVLCQKEHFLCLILTFLQSLFTLFGCFKVCFRCFKNRKIEIFYCFVLYNLILSC